jgi:hypothetical protein
MGVDIEKFIQSKEDWINFCREKNINSLDDYFRSCEIYDVLPKEPGDLYVNFSNIPKEVGFNAFRR